MLAVDIMRCRRRLNEGEGSCTLLSGRHYILRHRNEAVELI